MVKFLKANKVVVVLNGRYAGKKAVIVKNYDDGDAQRPYGHALIAGIERAPLKVTKTMGKKLVAKRTQIKPFLKVLNYNHLMPTRYSLAELALDKEAVSKQAFKDAEPARPPRLKSPRSSPSASSPARTRGSSRSCDSERRRA